MKSMTCIAIDDDSLYLKKLEAFVDEIKWLELLGTYTSPVQAATAIIKEEPDLLFVDIEMPHLDGYSFVEWIQPRLTNMDRKPEIVVISGVENKMDYLNDEILVHIPKLELTHPDRLEKTLKWALEDR